MEMKHNNFRIGICALILILSSSFMCAKAVNKANDSVRISILTCSPSNEIYGLFGHTAIRYQDFSKNEDVVFNYGIFDFNTPHFIWRFIKGETDYQLGVNDYNDFIYEYESNNLSVYEQVLNLTVQEKRAIYWALLKNYQPEHRVYRYNFFYDNCSTRPRDKVENLVKGASLRYDDSVQTFRDIIHEFTKGHPWDQFGIDLCLGSDADKPITAREKTFAPFYLRDALENASVNVNNKSVRKLVTSSSFLYKSKHLPKGNNFPFTPLQCSIILLFIVICMCIYEFKNNKILWIGDILLFGAAGIGGCILMFLACFSTHPAVSPNYLLFVLHPFHILGVISMIWCIKKQKKDYYSAANCIVLVLFLFTMESLPQQFNQAVILIALSLLLRSSMYVYFTIIKKIK